MVKYNKQFKKGKKMMVEARNIKASKIGIITNLLFKRKIT